MATGSTETVIDVTHPDGTAIDVRDEHLEVTKANGGVVALHAPGRWCSAEVVT
jgi:hypothetical protein